MAEEKKDSKPEKTEWVLYAPLILIGVLLVISSMIDGRSVFEPSNVDNEESVEASEQKIKNFFNVYQWIGNGEQRLGAIIINTDSVAVRSAPAGSVLGTQKKLSEGRLLEGPVEQFNTKWWRVDYEMAPDGWVEYGDLTTKIGLVKTVNILPITYGFYKPIGYIFIFILILFCIYFKMKLMREEKIAEKQKELKREQHEPTPQEIKRRLEEKSEVEKLPGFQTEEIVPTKIEQKNNRWKHIQELIGSYNSSDWRQAIIEADIMLEEMIDKMGYQGTSIGDKLKSIEKSDFITLDKAWSAHRIRNQIAHDGSAFKLTRDVAERTIKEYEMVFKEFYYI